MHFFRHVMCASGALSISSLGYFGYWTQQRAHQVSWDQRGSLMTRMKEVACAFQHTQQIEDKYTAEKHIESVALLSSKKSPSTNKLKDATTFYKFDLQEFLYNNSSIKMPVFDYNNHSSLIFSGSLLDLHSLKSRQDILSGNYIRCTLETVSPVDLLITGTSKPSKCSLLKNPILFDATVIAPKADQPIAGCSVKDWTK